MLITDTTIVNAQYVIEQHRDIRIQDGKIQEIAEHGKCMQTDTDTVNGRDLLFMPGLIDSHMHTGQQLLRGQVLDELPMIWTRIMLPFESTLTPEKMRFSAELAALEMIHAGTAGFVDAGSYYMEEAAEVYRQSGLRGALSYSTMDQKGLPESVADTAKGALEKTDALYDGFHQQGNLKVYYSLRALMSCSVELMEGAAARAQERDTMLQAHMNEYAGEVNFALERYGMRPYEFLANRGILSSQFLGAHSLMLSEKETELLQEYEVKICHCPFSNCAKAVPNTPAYLNRGISVGLGTDGTAHGGMSLWNEMKIFRSVMNVRYGAPAAEPRIMPAETILQMVLEGGAAALNEAGSIGKLETGYRADLIGISLNQPHLLPSRNLIHTLVESVNANDVTHMMVDGKWIMKNREILTLDEERILYQARNWMRKGEGGRIRCWSW